MKIEEATEALYLASDLPVMQPVDEDTDEMHMKVQRAALDFAVALLREIERGPAPWSWSHATFEDAIAALERHSNVTCQHLNLVCGIAVHECAGPPPNRLREALICCPDCGTYFRNARETRAAGIHERAEAMRRAALGGEGRQVDAASGVDP
ncbi:MAG TPA: hypothetical protein VFO62_10795 [Candidatus Binatia bacterium]|nr:hypothetical protein [Candidatus Binatia bacterium]